MAEADRVPSVWTGHFVGTNHSAPASALLMGWIVKRLQATSANLTTREQQFSAILEDQTDLICRFREDGTVLFANDAYCRMFGVDR